MKAVLKTSDLKRADLVCKEDLKSFWSMFILFGSIFSVMMLLVKVGIALAAAWFLSTASSRAILDEDWILIALINFLIYGSIMGFVFSRVAWRSPEHAKTAILRAGLCPACVYPIKGIPADEDECTLCPECGVSWRLPTIPAKPN